MSYSKNQRFSQRPTSEMKPQAPLNSSNTNRVNRSAQKLSPCFKCNEVTEVRILAETLQAMKSMRHFERRISPTKVRPVDSDTISRLIQRRFVSKDETTNCNQNSDQNEFNIWIPVPAERYSQETIPKSKDQHVLTNSTKAKVSWKTISRHHDFASRRHRNRKPHSRTGLNFGPQITVRRVDIPVEDRRTQHETDTTGDHRICNHENNDTITEATLAEKYVSNAVIDPELHIESKIETDDSSEVSEKQKEGSEVATNIQNPCVASNSQSDNASRGSDSVEMICRICHGGESLSAELGQLVTVCSCRGTVGCQHVRCLERWLTESGSSSCELCGDNYSIRCVRRYGVIRSLILYAALNPKQLAADILGILAMWPLAVLAAWLASRSMASLASENLVDAPENWSVASTFVLAGFTLVCYYCWLMCAATRHAVGWWVLYSSQYDIRLILPASNN